MVNLTPAEEHYLKRELLRLEVIREFENLNDANALRKFGEPFVDGDPKGRDVRRNRNKRLTLPQTHKDRINKDTYVNPLNYENNSQSSPTDFPVLNHFLRTFIMTFPLLSKDMVNDSAFWQGKVQVFFEHFMRMPFSSSFDREELTKRRKLSIKLTKAILLLYNSGIPVSKETDYYANENYQLVPDSEKFTKLNKFTLPSKESLKYLLTNEPVFFNGIDINIVAVVDESFLPYQLTSKPSKSTTNSWIKSTFGVNFSKLSIAESSDRKKYYFIIKVRTKEPRRMFFIFRPYTDFKELENNLNSLFPGKNIPRVPHKNKIDALAYRTDETTSSRQKKSPEEKLRFNVVKYKRNEDNAEENQHVLPRERLRTSLRQYLRMLCNDKEISTSLPLKMFLFSENSKISVDDFTHEIKIDLQNRENLDLINLENQIIFQKLAFERSLKLQNSLTDFKDNILKDKKFLLSIFRELKEKRDPSNLSPILRNFFDWSKAYISATIYQLFLGDDGSYEFYTQVRRLHKLMPYTLMFQILKFTNPLSIMKGMINLFMAQPFGGHSLLQRIFSTILTDDLKSNHRSILNLENIIINSHSGGSETCAFLRKCIFENEHGTFVNMDDVHDEAAETNIPMCIVLVSKGVIRELIPSHVSAKLMKSFICWKKEQQSLDNPVPINSKNTAFETESNYFLRIKEFVHLLIEERDKRLMKQLWNDPELSQLLKNMVTLFYEPMIRLFKIAQMDVAFKNFERFMNDLIDLLDSIIDGATSSATISGVVDDINFLVNKHETSFYQFAHDIYVNDSEGLFEGFIEWLFSVVTFLQKSKYSVLDCRLDLEDLLKASSCDVELLRNQLDNVISKKLKSRKAYSEIVKIKTQQQNEKPKNIDEIMNRQWKKLTNIVIPNESSDFGIVDSDLVDLDLDIQDCDYPSTLEENRLEKMYKELIEEDVDVSEIEKFLASSFKSKLNDFLSL